MEILHEISKIDGIEWIRFLYSYPESITDELINEVRDNPKICKYFDIPIQHISDKILKKMNRKSNGNGIRNLIKKIRSEIPNVILRTSLIVGFPTEDEKEFEELYEFVKEVQFDKLGVFQYSKEDGTVAEKMDGQISESVKKARWNKIMKIQKEISYSKLKEKVGRCYDVLLEGITDDENYVIGRTYMDVPDMDGVVYTKIDSNLTLGEFVKVKIIDIEDYDMIGAIER